MSNAASSSFYGTLVGTPTWISGQLGGALAFDSTDYVEIGNISPVNGAQQLTLSAWLRRSASGTVIVLGKQSSNNRVGVEARTNGTIRFHVSSGYFAAYGALASNDTAWHHYALVFDGALSGNSNRLKVYRDGVQQALTFSGTIPSSATISTTPFRLGRSGNTYSNGRIDDVWLFTRALSSSEIQQLALLTTDTEPPTSPTSLSATAASPSRISLTWDASADNVGVAGYRLFRDGVEVATSTATALDDVALMPSTQYTYTVAAYDSAGNQSPQSAPETATTLASAPRRCGDGIDNDGDALIDYPDDPDCTSANDDDEATTPQLATLGPLVVHPSNRRYFSDTAGRAVYLTGSHTWVNLIDRGTIATPPAFPYDDYIAFMNANHHNFMRMWTVDMTNGGSVVYEISSAPGPLPWARTGPGVANDGKPRFDLQTFDQMYFDRLRGRVIQAGQNGIYVSVMLFAGYERQFGGGGPDGDPFKMENNINSISCAGTCINNASMPSSVWELEKAYIRKVVDTVNDLDNVLYEVANEAGSYSTAWQYNVIDYIKQYEATKPERHPVGMTFQYGGGSDATLYSSLADWVSPSENLPAATGNKVIISDTDHAYPISNLVSDGPAAHRSWVWETMMRGGNPIFMDPYLVRFNNNPGGSTADPEIGTILDPFWNELRKALGDTALYAAKINLASMTPQGALTSTGYVLANAGHEYLVYQPGSGPFTLSTVAKTYGYEWFNPTLGSVVGTGYVTTSGGWQSFEPPFGGDAVLYLKESAPDGEAPSIPGAPTAGTVTHNSVSLSWSASTDNVGVAGYRILRGGVEIGTSPVPSFTDVDLTASTQYTYTVSAFDAAGNMSPPSGALVIATSPAPDTTPPATSIVVPGPGAVVAGAVSVSATASDDVDVVGVQFYLDGSALGSEIAAVPYEYVWDTTVVADGNHVLQARARDAAGNIGWSATTAVVVDNAPPPPLPTVTLEAEPTTILAGGSSTLTWSSTDAAACVASGGWSGSKPLSGSSLVSNITGNTTFTLTCTNETGTASDDATITVTPDTVPPSVPGGLSASSVTQNSLVLSWAASTDNVGVSGYKVFRNGVEVATTPTTSRAELGLSASTTYSYTVAAFDASGNVSAQSDTLTVTTVAPPPPPTGLVGAWSFNDSSGSILRNSASASWNGTLVSTPTWTAGKYGGALSFDGTDYVELGNITAINGVQRLTFMAWVKRSAPNAKLLLGKQATNQAVAVELWTDGKAYFEVSNGALAGGPVTLNDTSWHHVALVFDGTQSGNASRLKAYVDGNPKTIAFTGTVPSTTSTNTTPFRFGRLGSDYSSGLIDEARLYTRALTAAEVQSDMNTPLP